LHPSTLAKWRDRTIAGRLDRADLTDRRSAPQRPPNRTAEAVEARVLDLRRSLRAESVLGEYGARAIQDAMLLAHDAEVPAIRTIGRILERHGALDGRYRVRRPSPPPGWYLPDVARGQAELDCLDVVEDLVIRGGQHVDVLTAVSLHGSLCETWPMERVSAVSVVAALIEHWRAVGLPAYAQFDNDRRFQGPLRFEFSVGRVTRLCLSLGVVPVFAPPREHGPQSQMESFNGLWQRKVWRRFEHRDLDELRARSRAWVLAYRARHAKRIADAPVRRQFPQGFELDLQAHPQGRVIFLRRTDDQGRAELLKRTYAIDRHWVNRLIRCEVDYVANRIDFYGLRRRDPHSQPKLAEATYHLPRKPFHERSRR
jgi:hypothetical protein